MNSGTGKRLSHGVFITFEGVEGSGKSTQIERLRQYLGSMGYAVVVTREPGGTPIAEAIREVLLDPANSGMCPAAELLLYEAARAQHVDELIRPALEASKVVLCDRFADSTTAYQGAGRGLTPEILSRLHEIATGGMRPDLTVVIDVPAEVGLARARHAGAVDRIEAESIAFHERVREGFLGLAKAEPERVKVVDGNRTIEEVRAEIVGLVDALLRNS